jgi:hypothetical protein
VAPLAYFITFTTYGSWLHGRAPGSVDREHNISGMAFLPPDKQVEREMAAALRQEPYKLDKVRRQVALSAAHVRSNHLHVVISATCTPEKVMADLKAWCRRRLWEACNESSDRDRWTQHGSTRYLNDQRSLDAAVKYVIEDQGERLEAFDSRNEPNDDLNEPEA